MSAVALGEEAFRVWGGRKSVSTEKPLDLTQTELYSVNQPADTHVKKDPNLLTQTLTGSNPGYGISTVFRFATIPYMVYEISLEYYQGATQDQSYFLEVGDSWGYLATLGWYQNPVGSNVQISPSYGNALGWTRAAQQMIACWNTKVEPKKARQLANWHSAPVPKDNQGYFRRDNYGL